MQTQSLAHKYLGGLSKNSVLLAVASLFSDISTEMLYPILPIFLTHTLHASGSTLGLIEGIAQAMQNIIQGFSGWLSDRLQKRKSIALIGYFLSAAAKPLIGVSAVWQTALAARLLDRLGAGGRSAPRDAMIAASVSADHRGKAFGLEGVGDNAGACLGPLLTLLLLTFLHVDIRLIFYLTIIPGLLAFFMIVLVRVPATKTPEPAPGPARETRIDAGFRRFPKTYWKYLMATALFAVGNSSNAFLILQTQDIGVSLQTTILIYAAFNLMAALVSYPAGFLSDRLGRRNVLLGGLLIFLVAYIGFAFSRNMIVIALLFAMYGLYQGVFRSVGKALAADFVPELLRASGIGWYNTTVGLFGLVASIVAGQLWDHVSHPAVFIYGAVFAIIGGLALLVLVPSKRKGALGHG